jgi:hypothetical protein
MFRATSIAPSVKPSVSPLVYCDVCDIAVGSEDRLKNYCASHLMRVSLGGVDGFRFPDNNRFARNFVTV